MSIPACSMVSRQPRKFPGSKRPSSSEGASVSTADRFSGSCFLNRSRIPAKRFFSEIMIRQNDHSTAPDNLNFGERIGKALQAHGFVFCAGIFLEGTTERDFQKLE